MAVKVYEGKVENFSGKLAIVVSRFNKTITQRLLDGALYRLKKAQVRDNQIDVFWVPGAFELPTIADALAVTETYQAIICLGAVIKGETTHDQHINSAISPRFLQIASEYQMPILFGVLTCDTVEQANARSVDVNVLFGSDKKNATSTLPEIADKTVAPHLGNKGVDCAEGALEMISLMRDIEDIYDESTDIDNF